MVNRLIFLLFLTVSYLYSPQLRGQHINIEVGTVAANDIEKVFRENMANQTCLDIKAYTYKGSTRVYAEALLICQALMLGGIEPIFNFHQFPNFGRALKELKKGTIHMMFSTTWLSQQQSNFFTSEPLILSGEFEKGIYTLTDHVELLKVKDLNGLKTFAAISSNQFLNDWKMLSDMGIEIYSNPRWELLFKMLKAKHGDFILAEFSPEPDLSIITAGVKLIPVPNVKVTFKDSRHIFVNKDKDNSAIIFSALQSGIKILRQQGRIKKAYQDLGFYNDKTKSWLSLCCE